MIEARGVHKHYGSKAALDGVSFSIATGEVWGSSASTAPARPPC